ncbi:Protein CBG27546 [Caenorhabditis briggsae]|uniref:Uncharacterized protein n=2 Tax=Caenorhabditis briggsae TaxID=6238 RepID=A0AAE9JJB3_CAEBR|nr:Protein CBG27546 [Caenorhabditis briggsae]ULT88314.1 hypothetical protein L3Y34_007483 [Caenorhabditis briggsae]UMM34128.1 hypothetical protein L5515_007332 [Caenorhabditis briggsae]CAS00440.1 Protein CBG27546 [Caenorhabditis briggsae]
MSSINFTTILFLVIVTVLTVSSAPLVAQPFEIIDNHSDFSILREHLLLRDDDSDKTDGDIFYIFENINYTKVIDDRRRGGF